MKCVWKLLGRLPPEANAERSRIFKKAFQDLWLAGTLGALFFSLARNIPVHLGQFTYSFDIEYTLSVGLKYAYVLWLLAYFLATKADNDQPGAARGSRDIVFDVVQSTASIGAVYFLGFVIPIDDYGIRAFTFSSGAIFTICLLSLVLFWRRSPREGVNRLRVVGTVLAAGAVLLTLFGPSSTLWMLSGLWLLQVPLFIVLLLYLVICHRESPTRNGAAANGESPLHNLLTQACKAAADAARAATAASEAAEGVAEIARRVRELS